jgi:uncharacterized protein YfaP (DUF2135 family)
MKLFFLLFALISTSKIIAQNSNEILVLSAVVKNKVIPNAQVIFQKNGETSIPKLSNSEGIVEIPSEYQDDPNVTIIIKKEGYSTLVSKCRCGGLTYAISPYMQELDGMRIVLSWDEQPNDIDSHLSYPGGYVCYHQKDAVYANLDVDDTDSFGPETITISKKIEGKKYVYAVHNFSDRNTTDDNRLSTVSNAKVYVYIGNSLIKTYYIPQGKTGTVWIPFIIDETGNIVDVGDFKNSNSWEGVQSILRAYRFDGNYEENITDTDKELALQVNKKGEAAYHAGNIESSIYFYQQAIELNPRNGQFYSNLGLSFQKNSNEAEALWANRKAIEFASGTNAKTVKASSYYNIAKIYESNSQWNNALQYYKLAKQNKANPVYDKAILRVSSKIR